MTAVVDVHAISRVFEPRSGGPPIHALADVDLEIEAGEVHGLLGPNGAGKTTLVKILATVLLPTGGSARILGHDVVAEATRVRPLIGIVFGGERGLYNRLTARQNLEYWGALYGLSRGEIRRRSTALIERVGLAERADQRVEEMSRGMKQRLHLARGLIGDPRVLFLDEPTIGMDPVATREFRRFVGELRAEGRTLLLTTHDMAEAESLCDRVTMIDHGRVLATETPRSLARLVPQVRRVEAELDDDGFVEELRGFDGVLGVERAGAGVVRIEVESVEATRAVLRRLVEAGVMSVRTTSPSLEEVYLALIGDRGYGI